jgi:hypothetical protein
LLLCNRPLPWQWRSQLAWAMIHVKYDIF